jgi:hypothetical protein
VGVGAGPYTPGALPPKSGSENLAETARAASKLLPQSNRLEAESHIDAKTRVVSEGCWRAGQNKTANTYVIEIPL